MPTIAGKPAGSGSNFNKLVNNLMQKRGMNKEDAQKLAAWIGRQKYGNEGFQKMAAKGR